MTAGLRTLLVGIDAAAPAILRAAFDGGRLPRLHELFDGPSGALESQIPPWTASAWPSIYTGTNPGKHGVFDFIAFDGYDWDVVSAADVRRRSLWEYLDMHGFRSVVVNVPVTHPIRPFDGALVPGYLAPESPPCHPVGLLDDVEDAIGPYRVYGDVASATDCVRSRGAAFRYLADRFDPDFGFVQFQWTDTICHERPGDLDALGAVYDAVDETVGEIVDDCDPRNVVVVSDHGIGPYGGHEFRVNEFLADEGFVETTRGGLGMPSWADLRDRRLKRGDEADRDDPGLLERAAAGAANAGLTSQRIGAALRRVGLEDVVAAHAPRSAVSAATEQVDFPRSRAYMRSRIECGVRLNLAGREPDGVVPASAYDDVRADLIDRLARVETPTGVPVFETVAPREAFYYGSEADRAVDVVVVPTAFDQFLSARVGDGQFGPPSEPWNHKLTGVVAAAGADVDESAPVGDAHIYDVAPTVLATFGVPADATMDGRPLPFVSNAGERFYDDPVPEVPAASADASTTTGDAAVVERLSDLGYLE